MVRIPATAFPIFPFGTAQPIEKGGTGATENRKNPKATPKTYCSDKGHEFYVTSSIDVESRPIS